MSRHVFGPVPSRRLGRSLGVDVVSLKTCSFDCVYCQLGATQQKTIERHAWVPLDQVIADVQARLGSRPDYITLSGSGEPTLYCRIGALIDRIKSITDIPVAVMTNGSMLGHADVRGQLLRADLVAPSLDAGDEAAFQQVNRPDPRISFDRLIEGLTLFGAEYAGRYWLEVFVVAGVTDNESQMSKIAAHAQKIKPDRVQLNTAVRPPAERWVHCVSREQLERLGALFDPPAEIIAEYHRPRAPEAHDAGRRQVLNMLRRRPCTPRDIADGLGLPVATVSRHVRSLHDAGKISPTRINNEYYYQAGHERS